MQPVTTRNVQNQTSPTAQKKRSEPNKKSISPTTVKTDEGKEISLADTVTLSAPQTENKRSTSSAPSIPVSHAEMKALYKAFSVKI